MRIQELIQKLSHIKEEYGNVEIYVVNSEYGDSPLKDVYKITDYEEKFMYWAVQ